MSSILTKPFSWANRIVQAVFKGSPNLITTSDLNRQIEALKKEMYVLQQASSVVISDLQYTIQIGEPKELKVFLNYVYCSGVRFDFLDQNEFGFSLGFGNTGGTKELRLYAKKELVTYEDDFTKNISGAKFSDGTTLPAANHYVYSEPILRLVNRLAIPDDDFEYASNSGKEYICTLLRIGVANQAAISAGGFGSDYYVQKLTVPMGSGSVDLEEKYGKFDQFELAEKSLLRESLIPNADDDWKKVAHKLWSRLYTLEKRLFMETLYDGEADANVNGESFPIYRSNSQGITSTTYGEFTLSYSFYVIGNICFVNGSASFEKNTGSDSQLFAAELVPADNELPFGFKNAVSSVHFNVYSDAVTEANKIKNLHVMLDYDRLLFRGIPSTGINLTFSGSYCFSSKKFWDYSKDDRFGLFYDQY